MPIVMRKLSCWAIIAVLTIHMSIYSMDNTNNEIDFDIQETDDISQTSGRDSHQMSGNQSGNNPNCNFTNMADGMGGPVWDSAASYNLHDIVEWPAGSGHFWQSTTAGPTGEPDSNGKWIGPCDCAEISEISGIIWDANTAYDPWQIVDHNGSIWIAQDAGANPGQEPVVGTDLWVMCEDSTPCDELIGMTNIVVWDETMLVSEGEIYEYPANSGDFYMVAPFINDQTVGEPGIDLDAWDQEYCDCMDIWKDSGEPVWDSSTTYSVNSVVEHPSGSGDIWIATAPSTAAGVEPGQPWADGNEWELCSSSDEPSGGPCDDLDVPVWDNTTTPVVGDIYEYPANSDTFYEIIFIHDDPNGGPGYINFPEDNGADEFWKPYNCPCKDTWVANGEPVWVSGTAYPGNYVVEHPANSGNLYIPLESGGVSVGGGEPGIDMHWVLCEGQEPSQSPCAGLDVIGVWDNSNVPVIGDIYEYPPNSEEYWEIIFDHDGNISEPGINGAEEFWAPVNCPCKETWVANGEPVWVSGTAYPGNYVVEHPAGSGNLYIPLESGGVSVGGGEPGIDMHWVLCDGQEPSQGPCDDLDYPVWDQTTVAAVGDIYEYPANSDNYYQVTYTDAGGMITTPPGEDQDDEFWTPYSCPCKDTWVANGQPVWDSTITNYAGNYVVEWPAGSGNLYISEGGGLSNSVEPGTDGHWIPCEGNEDVEDEATPDKVKSEEGSIPSIGAFATLLGIIAASAFVRRKHAHE